MRFGIFDHLERQPGIELSAQYEHRLQLLELADEAGFHGYHLAQHHHSPLCLASNQSVFLAAVAGRTERLRFGPLVYVLPLHHPIRLIEEIGMVDQLSNGRYFVGVGKGTGGGTERAMWGDDPAETEALFDETLEVMLAGLQSEFLTHKGKFFDFQELWMEVRPKQQPHPPLWYAGNPVKAGRGGMNFIGAGSIKNVATATQAYLEARGQAEAGGASFADEPGGARYGGMKHLFIAEDEDEARERAVEAYEVYRSHFAKPAPGGAPATTGSAGAWNSAAERSIWFREQANVEVLQGGPASLDGQKALEMGAMLAGSPATIRDYVQRYAAESGANYFVGAFQWGDLTHEESANSMRLFAQEVMPAVAARAG